VGRGGIGAMPPQLEVVQQLTQMGYDEGLIRRAADTTGWWCDVGVPTSRDHCRHEIACAANPVTPKANTF